MIVLTMRDTMDINNLDKPSDSSSSLADFFILKNLFEAEKYKDN